MTAIVWALVLTACASDGACYKQTIEEFETANQCIDVKILHESLPEDGDWAKIEYTCGVVGALNI